MLIKVLHQENSKVERFPNNGVYCWKLAFSVLVLKDKKYQNKGNAVH